MKRISNLQLITVLILLCIVGFQHPAYAQPRVDVETKDEIRLKSTDWLNGHGVDVYYPSDINKEHETKPDGTMEYECVELVVRLYKTVGYTNTWPIGLDAYNMARVAKVADAARNDQTKTKKSEVGFDDLAFFENMTSTIPPQPGDIIVWKNAQHGHVAIINRVAGEWVEIVQQNIWYGGKALVTEEMQLLIDAKGQYTLQSLPDGWNKNKPMGWVHSLRMVKALATQIVPVERTNNNISWNLDTSAIYVYLSPSFTKTIRKNDQDEGAIVVPLFNDSRGITAFTTQAHTYCMARNAVYEIQNDPRFDPNKGVKSVDFTIKYTGSRMWIRPWGGSMSGQWIEFNDIQCGSSW